MASTTARSQSTSKEGRKGLHTRVSIELDIFSGRANPRWQLDGRATRRLRQLHAGLAVSSTSPPEPPGLGYRGFKYTLDDVTWRAFGGYVIREGTAALNPAVERYLLQCLPDSHRDLRPRIESALGS
jgi:hypothetical protein